MRHFMGMLFLGNGNVSKSQADFLHNILGRAISDLSCLQQPPHTKEECEAYERTKVEIEKSIEDTVRDIAEALTGMEITFGKKIPYNKARSNYPFENETCSYCGEKGHWRPDCPDIAREVIRRRKLEERPPATPKPSSGVNRG